jgi:hypothetical protein
LKQIRKRLTYANVMSSLVVFLILGGGAAFAATKLGKNSVGTKQIKNQAVTAAKIKKQTITGTQVNLAKLGTVPSATSATTASTANALSPLEPMHVVNAAGEPPFEGGSINFSAPTVSGLPPASFYKDHEGIVHLEGFVQVGKEGTFSNLVPIFTLPPGLRPANGVVQIFSTGPESAVLIGGTNASYEGHSVSGGVFGEKEKPAVLSGITYRAQG